VVAAEPVRRGRRAVKFAYADPPYLGRCSYYGHNHPEGDRPFDGQCWNDLHTHELLIDWLDESYPDGWALSCSSSSLRYMLYFSPDGTRTGSWVKPFASFKPGINPGYCWEPLLFKGGRRLGRDVDTVRDYVSANIVLERGTKGAKPEAFCNWVMDLLGYDPQQDSIDDLFHGSGAFSRAIERRASQQSLVLL
jgi:hypothetical protein